MKNFNSNYSTFLNQFIEAISDIKIVHSLFALPFALFGSGIALKARLGENSWISNSSYLISCTCLLLGCMITARTFAMLANRIFDSEIDLLNPRTMNRAIPSGRLKIKFAINLLLLSAGIFVLLTIGFGLIDDNWWPLYLSLPVLIWIGLYPFTKRFTSACHLWLGISLGISPVCAALAVWPASLIDPTLWLLAIVVIFWVTGFDILYSLQDLDVDKKENIYSVPSKIGPKKAQILALILHTISIAFLVCLGLAIDDLKILWWTAVTITFLLIIGQHAIVYIWGNQKVLFSFLILNISLSIIIGTSGIIDLFY